MPSRRAASRRPWPARIMLAASMTNGFKNPNFRMLAAIWRICFLEWVRAFLGLGRIVAIGAHSIRGESEQSARLPHEVEAAFEAAIAAPAIITQSPVSAIEHEKANALIQLVSAGWPVDRTAGAVDAKVRRDRSFVALSRLKSPMGRPWVKIGIREFAPRRNGQLVHELLVDRIPGVAGWSSVLCLSFQEELVRGRGGAYLWSRRI